MSYLILMARTWMDRDEGATALEYAVLVVAIVLALLAGATIFGDALGAFFETLFPLT
jgi:Flp pilus assembly pilin Flp